MENRLNIITQHQCTDMLRTPSTRNESCLALFNPRNDRYILRDGTLYLDGRRIKLSELVDHVSDETINQPLEDYLFLVGIFSFLHNCRDLHKDTFFVTSLSEVSNYLGVTQGSKGFRLLEKLKSFAGVYGVIFEEGVFPVLDVFQSKNMLFLSSEYLHRALNVAIMKNHEMFDGKRPFYTDLAFANLVAARNKVSAQIAVELLTLIVKTGKAPDPHVAVTTLAERIPKLHDILYGNAPEAARKRQFYRAFDKVIPYLRSYSSLFEDYADLEFTSGVQVLGPTSVIRIRHSGCIGNERSGVEKA